MARLRIKKFLKHLTFDRLLELLGEAVDDGWAEMYGAVDAELYRRVKGLP
jgi:hypothetical protein